MTKNLAFFPPIIFFYSYILDIDNDSIYHRQFVPIHDMSCFFFFLFFFPTFNPSSYPYLQKHCSHFFPSILFFLLHLPFLFPFHLNVFFPFLNIYYLFILSISCIREIMPYLYVCICLISLKGWSLNIIHLAKNVLNLFFFFETGSSYVVQTGLGFTI